MTRQVVMNPGDLFLANFIFLGSSQISSQSKKQIPSSRSSNKGEYWALKTKLVRYLGYYVYSKISYLPFTPFSLNVTMPQISP